MYLSPEPAAVPFAVAGWPETDSGHPPGSLAVMGLTFLALPSGGIAEPGGTLPYPHNPGSMPFPPVSWEELVGP